MSSSPASAVEQRHIPFMDLSFQWRQIESALRPELDELCSKSAFVLGPWVEAFERDVAKYLGSNHAVGVNSGTSALHLALIAAGVGPGDAVLVPANTFIATLWAVLYVGARPILCDVNDKNWTIDLTDAEKRLDNSVRAIMLVHLYGQPGDVQATLEFAKRHDLKVIEDVAQAIGADVGGRMVGNFGFAGCFSFYPGKNLGAAGEGGLVIVSDPDVAARLKRLRHHAQRERYVHNELGFNYRLDGIQALILTHKLRHLDKWTAERRKIAERYLTGLAGLDLQLPTDSKPGHVWHLFVIHTPHREKLQSFLKDNGIDTGLHYPVPLHRQPCLSHFGFDQSSFPNSDRNARECLSLPLFPGLSLEQVDYVIDKIRSFKPA